MIKFLTALLALLDKVFAFIDQKHWKQQGRQEAIKEADDALNHEIEQAKAAVSNPDPERDERLRDRFDRSHQ